MGGVRVKLRKRGVCTFLPKWGYLAAVLINRHCADMGGVVYEYRKRSPR